MCRHRRRLRPLSGFTCTGRHGRRTGRDRVLIPAQLLRSRGTLSCFVRAPPSHSFFPVPAGHSPTHTASAFPAVTGAVQLLSSFGDQSELFSEQPRHQDSLLPSLQMTNFCSLGGIASHRCRRRRAPSELRGSACGDNGGQNFTTTHPAPD